MIGKGPVASDFPGIDVMPSSDSSKQPRDRRLDGQRPHAGSGYPRGEGISSSGEVIVDAVASDIFVAEEIVDAEEVVNATVIDAPPGWIRRILRAFASAWEWCFGCVSLVIGLAILATIPIVQLVSLGYLLEVAGRIARTGRLSAGWVGIRKAARVGSIVLGTWLVMLPVTLISSYWYSARLIDADSPVAARWSAVLIIAVIVAVGHILWAWYRGGRLRHFFWPAPVRFVRWLRQPGKIDQAADALWDFVTSLRLGYYFRLGLVGFLGTVAWLFIPVLFGVAATDPDAEGQALWGLISGVTFALAVFHLPMVQVEYAADGKWRRLFDVKRAWKNWYRVPLAGGIALTITLAFALPLYLLKIELLPREVTYLPSLLFVLFALPSRWVQGWAVARARKKANRKLGWFHALMFLPLVGAAGTVATFYSLLSFFTRYTSWYGGWSLLEQHAFLVPVPFLGW